VNDARLIFVYNADSGLFNTLTDIAHKAFSPQTYQCSLCAITHDLLQEKGEWKDFVATLPVTTEFLHRDEFSKAHHSDDDVFPAIYMLKDDQLTRVVTADELARLETIDALKQRVIDLTG